MRLVGRLPLGSLLGKSKCAQRLRRHPRSVLETTGMTSQRCTRIEGPCKSEFQNLNAQGSTSSQQVDEVFEPHPSRSDLCQKASHSRSYQVFFPEYLEELAGLVVIDKCSQKSPRKFELHPGLWKRSLRGKLKAYLHIRLLEVRAWMRARAMNLPLIEMLSAEKI